ncbi:MAG: Kelch motif family protein [candidate division TM6 bacterium GW2011_GWF2_37_49]|nr:MAG: Kelch motif family protein [candidate division TM6 bacterium GW2011_GWF2_37_49]
MLGLMLSGLTVFAMEEEIPMTETPPPYQIKTSPTTKDPIEPAILEEKKSYIQSTLQSIQKSYTEALNLLKKDTAVFDILALDQPSAVTHSAKHILANWAKPESESELTDLTRQNKVIHAYFAALLKLNLFCRDANPELGDFGLIKSNDKDAKDDNKAYVSAIVNILDTLVTTKNEFLTDAEITKIVLTNLPQNTRDNLKSGWLTRLFFNTSSSKTLLHTVKLAAHDFYSKNCFLGNKYLELTSITELGKNSTETLKSFVLFRQDLENQKQNVSDSQDKEILQIMIQAVDTKIEKLSTDRNWTTDQTKQLSAFYKLKQMKNAFTNSSIGFVSESTSDSFDNLLKMIGMGDWDGRRDNKYDDPNQIKGIDQNVLQTCQNIENAYLLFITLQLQIEIFNNDSTEQLLFILLNILSKIIELIPTPPAKISLSQLWLYDEFTNALPPEVKQNHDIIKYRLARLAFTFCHQNPVLVNQYFFIDQSDQSDQYKQARIQLIACIIEQQKFYKSQKDAYKQQFGVTRAIDYSKRMIFGAAETHLIYEMLGKLIKAEAERPTNEQREREAIEKWKQEEAERLANEQREREAIEERKKQEAERLAKQEKSLKADEEWYQARTRRLAEEAKAIDETRQATPTVTTNKEQKKKAKQRLKEFNALQAAAAAERQLQENANKAIQAAEGEEKRRLVVEEIARRKTTPQNVLDLIRKTDAND